MILLSSSDFFIGIGFYLQQSHTILHTDNTEKWKPNTENTKKESPVNKYIDCIIQLYHN